jgi:preprotein translocase subunit SecY
VGTLVFAGIHAEISSAITPMSLIRLSTTTIMWYVKKILFNWNIQLAFEIVISLTAGAMIVLWISELITEYGLGNGASLLIFTNIASSLPNLAKSILTESSDYLNPVSIFLIAVLFFIVMCGIILLQEGSRIIPLISAKQLSQNNPVVSDLPKNNYIPLRLNQAGVMPIIFTASILVLPNYLINAGIIPIATLPFLLKSSKLIYWVSYFTLILTFSYFYSTIVLNPKEISEDLQKMAVSIPGVPPGKATTYYLKQIMKRITFIGAFFLAILTTFPNIIEAVLHVSNLKGLGATSLLILVGVTLDMTRQIRSVILSNIYKEMLK